MYPRVTDTNTAHGGDLMTVRITFSDDSTVELRSVMTLGEEFTSASRISDLMNANCLAFDVDGKTMFFPLQSIRYIEVHPALKVPNAFLNSGFTLISGSRGKTTETEK